MEDFSREIKKNVASYPAHKPAKQTQKWTLLFVGSHGKTIVFKRFKGLAVFFVLLLFTAGVAAAGMYVLYDLQVKKVRKLEQESEVLKKQIAALKQEKDALIIRAAKAESEPSKPDSLKKDSKPEPLPAELPKPEAKSEVKEEPPRLSVENFETSYHRSRKILTLKFNVKNAAASEQKFSGYAIAILKTSNRKSLNVPYNIDLASGKPVEKPQGESFEMSKSKHLEMEVKGEKDPERFETATVFILDKSGRILFEKDVPLKITY
jgi:cell division protein FtsB